VENENIRFFNYISILRRYSIFLWGLSGAVEGIRYSVFIRNQKSLVIRSYYSNHRLSKSSLICEPWPWTMTKIMTKQCTYILSSFCNQSRLSQNPSPSPSDIVSIWFLISIFLEKTLTSVIMIYSNQKKKYQDRKPKTKKVYTQYFSRRNSRVFER
jgi:hypothetical protein